MRSEGGVRRICDEVARRLPTDLIFEEPNGVSAQHMPEYGATSRVPRRTDTMGTTAAADVMREFGERRALAMRERRPRT